SVVPANYGVISGSDQQLAVGTRHTGDETAKVEGQRRAKRWSVRQLPDLSSLIYLADDNGPRVGQEVQRIDSPRTSLPALGRRGASAGGHFHRAILKSNGKPATIRRKNK